MTKNTEQLRMSKQNPQLAIDIQDVGNACVTPHPEQIKRWVAAALRGRRASGELSIRIVGFDEIRALNKQYRNKDKPTNVLSFPSRLPGDLGSDHLGDIVICAPQLEKEAKEHHKPLMAHWAHLVIHGTLHLLGFDHQTESDANAMESLETTLLTGLGFDDPYGEK